MSVRVGEGWRKTSVGREDDSKESDCKGKEGGRKRQSKGETGMEGMKRTAVQ